MAIGFRHMLKTYGFSSHAQDIWVFVTSLDTCASLVGVFGAAFYLSIRRRKNALVSCAKSQTLIGGAYQGPPQTSLSAHGISSTNFLNPVEVVTQTAPFGSFENEEIWCQGESYIRVCQGKSLNSLSQKLM